jgi:RNA polymerase sigma factor (sigma-70 family)
VATNRHSIGPLLQVICGPDAASKTDGQLLEQFLTRRDEAAFAVLVRRHGAMVLGVCRRVLGDATDADDAFQAAFLILVRKAATLTARPFLGDWLHAVARHTALKAKVAAARRRAKERNAAGSPRQPTDSKNEWLPLLDEELGRLPRKYQAPIMLCDLEGRTRQEAAEQLGWPAGTVAGRLVRGRALLARRLLRAARPLARALPALLADGAATAALPPGLVARTAKAAADVAAGNTAAQGVLSAEALAIAQGVMQSMFWNKCKIRALALVAALFITAAGGLAFHALAGAGQPPQTTGLKSVGQPPPAPAGPGKQPDKKAAKARYEALMKAAQAQFEARWDEYCLGKTTADFVIPPAIQWLQAKLKLSDNKADKIAAYQAHLERMTEFEKIAKAKYEAGSFPASQYYQTLYHRIEAEIWLDEFQAMK